MLSKLIIFWKQLDFLLMAINGQENIFVVVIDQSSQWRGKYKLQDLPNLKELDKQDKDVTILIKRLECALELKISKGPIYLRLKELNFEIFSLRREYSFEIRVSFLYIV